MTFDTRAEFRWAQHQQTWRQATARPADAHLAAHAAMATEVDRLRAECERLTERLAAVTPVKRRAKRQEVKA